MKMSKVSQGTAASVALLQICADVLASKKLRDIFINVSKDIDFQCIDATDGWSAQFNVDQPNIKS
jgi:hypothetical protein